MELIRLSRGILAGAAILGGAGCGFTEGTDPPAETTYFARLQGDAVRPTPVATTASGTGIVIISQDGSIKFNITVTVLTDVTMAHLHVGAPGAVGAIVVDLLPVQPPGLFAGNLASGPIKANNVIGGETLASLKAHFESGNVYMDIHTAADPGGTLRGQLGLQ